MCKSIFSGPFHGDFYLYSFGFSHRQFWHVMVGFLDVVWRVSLIISVFFQARHG
jgi:hypothetical protein